LEKVKERPILFSAPMVRAILEGKKTQTRRVLNRILGVGPITEFGPSNTPGYDWNYRDKQMRWHDVMANGVLEPNGLILGRCPYGRPGGRLWVRETWRPYGWREDGPLSIQFKDMTIEQERGREEDGYEDWYERMAFQASEECEAAGCGLDGEDLYSWDRPEECPIKWRPSIHMPRWASRIDLEVVRVRVERLQGISEADAIAEGINEGPNGYYWGEDGSKNQCFVSPKFSFANLVNFVNNGPNWNMPGHPKPIWDENPWVWVIEFKRIRP